MSKKEKKKMRDIPPTPPIEREEKEKESSSSAPAARACARLPAVIDLRTPPSLELLLAFAHKRCDFHDDDFTREWYRVMNDEYMWCYPETGTPIRHWPAYFRLWRVNRSFFERLRDPERIPDARKGRTAAGGRKADNWRGTKPENMDDVL